ncbi:glycosyl hydrolase, family 31 [Ancylostoma ceylanicum]|uniref:Glycosyl hydrolase, family 31 n=1 Tax=Ancylostoma ceylanicum TaxID=53326 RepID=A0A0D6LTJ3_9BILA|nr:glycosyl hydrolase, family 31 [Ancylostoma ceylanicum]
MEITIQFITWALFCCLFWTEGVRFDCYPEQGASPENCNARGCIWQPTDEFIKLKKNGSAKSPWSNDINEIFFAANMIGKTLNVKIFVPGRYEPPVKLPRNPSTSKDTLQLATKENNKLFAFAVIRKSSKRRLFDTSIGGLIFADKFLQIATLLPSDVMYGLGEHLHPTLKEVITAPGPTLIYRTIGGNLDLYFFPGPTPEEVTQQYLALVGTPYLPAYWALGFQISRYGYKNLKEMEEIIGRNIKAGVPLDTVVADIDYMDRYKDFTIGKKTVIQDWKDLPVYVKELHNKGLRTILIFDPAIQVDHDSFKRAMDMGARFVEWERHDQVMRNIQDQYPLAKNTKIMLGVVWPDRHVAFPDFLDNNTAKWWTQEFVRFWKKDYFQQVKLPLHSSTDPPSNIFKKEPMRLQIEEVTKTITVPYDGIWIDMNEPSSFGTNENHPWYYNDADHPNIQPLFCPTNPQDSNSQWDEPPYKTQAVYQYGESAHLSSITLCMTAVQANGTHRFYNVKSLYGLTETIATLDAQYKATKKRGIVVSRSTFPSSGHYGGHWLGDNTATWADLQSAAIGVQEFNMFGIPYVGTDICGFNKPTNEELCLRWQQMGAFHPFMRLAYIQLTIAFWIAAEAPFFIL